MVFHGNVCCYGPASMGQDPTHSPSKRDDGARWWRRNRIGPCRNEIEERLIGAHKIKDKKIGCYLIN